MKGLEISYGLSSILISSTPNLLETLVGWLKLINVTECFTILFPVVLSKGAILALGGHKIQGVSKRMNRL